MPVSQISRAAIGGSAAIMRAVRDPDCQLAIWHRAPPFAAADLLAQAQGNVRLMTTRDDLVPDFCRAIRRAGYRPSRAREALIADVADLAEIFAAIVRSDAIEVRLEIVDTDSCRKFHADFVRARLITTYAGPGTEWLDDEDAARVKRGEEPRRIHALQAGEVGIFKGRLASDRPAIHRSPPIAGLGVRRLLLAINPEDETLMESK